MKWCAGLGLLLVSISACLDKEAASSGQTGCSRDEVQISDENGSTWVATCHGERYYCSHVTTGQHSGQINCHAAAGSNTEEDAKPATTAVAKRATPEEEPPNGVAGFNFGTSVIEASSVCTEHGYTWEPATEDHFRCSGAPLSVGVDAEPIVRFCDEKLCAVSLQVGSADTWLATFTRFERLLTKKYGPPAHSKGVVYSNCATEAQFQTCLASGKLELARDWKWESNARISLHAGANSNAPQLQVIYVRKQRGVIPEAL